MAHPQLELAGLWVHSDNKAGRDAGELCGIAAVGVTATQDADALLALGADAICYTASSDIRPGQVIEDLGRNLFAHACHAHLEELVEIAGKDGEELHPLKQRSAGIHRLVQYAAIELEPGEFTVAIQRRIAQVARRFGR